MDVDARAREIVRHYGPLKVARLRPALDNRRGIKTFSQAIGQLDSEAAQAIAALVREAVAEEREAIARFVEVGFFSCKGKGNYGELRILGQSKATQLAKAIRARN